jgi:hypothetical protein
MPDRSVRAVAVQEPSAGSGPADYADAFEIRMPAPDGRTAEQWARCALEQAPAAVQWTIRIAHAAHDVPLHRRIAQYRMSRAARA